MHVVIDYPDEAVEGEIIRLDRAENAQKPKGQRAEPAPVPQQAIFDARGEIDSIFVSDLAQKLHGRLGFRDPVSGPLRRTAEQVDPGRRQPARQPRARPLRAARAWLDGHDFVTPDHVRGVVHDCLRHRLILSYEALSQGVTRRSGHRQDRVA